MANFKYWFLVLAQSLILLKLCASEFVPVYIWGTKRVGKAVPALQKISENSFKDEILTQLTDTTKILIFAEHSLSPEDFRKKDQSGNLQYPNLSKARKTAKITYYPNVENPLKTIKQTTSADDIVEISINDLLNNNNNYEFPNNKFIIIDLNDDDLTAETEKRFNLLKRHDESMISIYDKALEKYNNDVIAFYTGYHASWIGSSEINSRKTRDLLESDDPTINSTSNVLMDNKTILFYTSGDAVVNSAILIPVTYTVINKTDNEINLNGLGNNTKLNINFVFTKILNGYWYLENVIISYNGSILNKTTRSTIFAPIGFSYACGSQSFRNENFTITFLDFQVEPIFKNTSYTRATKFDDPYNCVGFTTIPIWSGLFVTFILLLIMTLGLTMMVDIKTMDRFDDAKGKTITINTSE